MVLRQGRAMSDRPRLRLVSPESEVPEEDDADNPPLSPFAAGAIEQSAMRGLLRGLSMLAASAGERADASRKA